MLVTESLHNVAHDKVPEVFCSFGKPVRFSPLWTGEEQSEAALWKQPTAVGPNFDLHLKSLIVLSLSHASSFTSHTCLVASLQRRRRHISCDSVFQITNLLLSVLVKAAPRLLVFRSIVFVLQQMILVRFKFCAIKMGTPSHSSHFSFSKCVDSVSEWVLWPAGSAGSFYFCWRTHSWYNFSARVSV